MRKYRPIIAAIMVAFIAVPLMTGCGGSDSKNDEDVNKLIGTWVLSLVTGTHPTQGTRTWTAADGISGTLTYTETTIKGTIAITDGPEIIDATYTMEGNVLTILEDGETDIHTYSIDGNTLTQEFDEVEDGVTYHIVLTLKKG
jgi:hypothetical protein